MLNTQLGIAYRSSVRAVSG